MSIEGGVSTGKRTIGEGLKVFVKYLVPLFGVVAGFASAQYIGGTKAISDLIYNSANGNFSGASAIRIAGVVMAAIFGLIGMAFWHLRSGGSIWMEGIGGFVAGFAFGVALGNVPSIISGTKVFSGVIESLSSGMQQAATGG